MSNALGWVQVPVVPVFNGINAKLSKSLVKPAEDAGRKAAKAVDQSAKDMADSLERQAKASKSKVDQLEKAIKSAGDKRELQQQRLKAAIAEQTAAEEKYQAALAKGGSGATELAKLERAKAKVTNETIKLTAAEERVEQAEHAHAAQLKDLEQTLDRAERAHRELNEEVEKSPSVMGRAGEKMRELGDAAKSMGGKALEVADKYKVHASVALGAIAAMGKAATDYASEAEQSYGAVESIFGKHADSIVAKSKEASSAVGLSGREYRELSATTGAMLKNMGMPMEEVSGTTQDLVTLGADLAATFGGPTKDAMEAIGSLLRGEANPIERYGVSIKKADINARMAADGLDKLEGEALKQAEAQTMLALLMEQTADAQGQFARETDTAAHKQQVATAKIDDAKEAIGTALLPVMSEVMDKAARLAEIVGAHPRVFLAAAGAVASFAGAIVGLATLGAVTRNLKELSGILTNGKGLKNVSKLLGGIKINPWIAGIAAAVAALTWFFTKTETGKKLWEDFTKFLAEAWRRVSESLGAGVEWIIEKWGQLTGFLGKVKDSVAEVFNILFKGDFTGEGKLFGLDDESSGIVDFLFGIRETAIATWDTISGIFTTAKDLIGGIIDILFHGDFTGLPFGIEEDSPVVGVLFGIRETAIAVKDGVVAAFQWMADKWAEFATGVGQFYDTWIAPAWELFQTATQLLAQWIVTQWQAITDGVQAMWNTVKPVFEFFLEGWRILSDGIAAIGSTVIEAVWENVKMGAQLLWTVLQGIFNQIKIGFELVGTVLRSVWDNMIAPVFGIFRQAAGLLADVLTGNFSNIGDRFQSMGEHLRTIVMGPITVAKDTFLGLIRAMGQTMDNLKETAARAVTGVLSKMKEMVRTLRRIPSQIGEIFSNAGQWLVNAGKNVVQGLINGVMSMAGKVGDAIKSILPSSVGGLIGFSDGGRLPGFASGGRLPRDPASGVLPRIPGIPRSQRDPIIGLNHLGVPVVRVEPEEFVVNRDDTARNLPLLHAVNSGATIAWQVVSEGRTGSQPTRGGDLPGYAAGGVIQPMINIVKQKYPMLQVTSTIRPGQANNHGAGLAVDFSNGSGNTPQQLALARDIARVYPESLELIYDSPGWTGNIKNGKNVGAFGQFYTLGQAGPHHHHVHWAMKTPPTKPLDTASTGSTGNSGNTSQGPANLPPMKWSENMLTVNAVRAGRAIALQFPQVQAIGGYRAQDPYPDHPSGRALDVMTYTDKALGDRILNYLFDHNDKFKMQYAIWQQSMWYKKGTPQPMADRGSPTQNHMDHVHAYFEASPRVTGKEIYPNTVGAGGATTPTMQMGDANLPLTIGKGAPGEASAVSKTVNLPNVDYGTAAQLASKWETEHHRDESLREYLKRKARVYDKGGIVPKGGIMVNLDDPEVVFPKKESATLLEGMRYMPGVAQHLGVIARHSPKTAAAIEQVANSDMAERLVTSVAFIGDQLREMADGSNIRSYLSSMRVSEGVGLADHIGQLAGVTQIGSLFGGMAKGYEGLEDAAVQQVDAANAVRQAEDNLASARKQYAQMLAESGADPELSTKTTRKVEDAERKLAEARKAGNAKKIADAERALSRVREDASEELKKSGSKNADELLKASEAVTAAENERSKALGVVKMAASAAGQAQVAMALEAVEFVVKVGKWIKELIDRVRQSYVDAKKALATGMGEIAKWAELVHEWQFQVASLQQKLVRGVNEQREAERDLHIAIHDRLTKQAAEEANVAKARLGLDKEIKRGAKIAQLKMMGLHEDWDSYLAYEALASRGVMKEWSDQAISELYRYEATRAKAAKAELEGRITQLKAESALAAATRQNARNQADLLTAQERLIKMSAKVAGVDLAEATAGAQLAKLFAQMAEVQMGIEDDWKGRHGYNMGYQGRHANEYRGRLAQRDSIQRSIDAVLAESGLSLDGVDYDKMLKQMAYVQRHGGDALNVARAFMPKLVEAESSMMVHDSLKPIWDAQDKLKDENRKVEDFLAEIDLYEATSPLENSVKALEYTVQGLTDAAEAWQEGNEEIRGEYLHSARTNRQAAESLGVRWQIDPRYDTGNLRERIAKEETIYLDGEQMYTADQIDQLLAKVTDGSNVRYKIRSASEVVNRRRERV